MAVQRLDRPARSQQRAAEQPWALAAADAFQSAVREIRREGRRTRRQMDADGVHDLRVATRRARTTIDVFEDVVDRTALRPVRRELRRLADRLGMVRDLDVMLESISHADPTGEGLEALRDAWTGERDEARRRLRAELGRGRFRRSLSRGRRLAADARDVRPRPGEPTLQVRHEAAPSIWSSYGRLLAFHVDPATTDALAIHRMRIAAKRLRYVLETFEAALGPEAAPLIERVTAVQDLAGEAHDAGVAAARARTVLAAGSLDQRELSAIERYAADRDRDAGRLTTIAERLSSVQGPTFRRTLARLLTTM